MNVSCERNCLGCGVKGSSAFNGATMTRAAEGLVGVVGNSGCKVVLVMMFSRRSLTPVAGHTVREQTCSVKLAMP